MYSRGVVNPLPEVYGSFPDWLGVRAKDNSGIAGSSGVM